MEIKKTQNERILEMKKFRNANTIQETKERISAIENTIEEMDVSFKKNIKSKKFLTQNMQVIWDTMKRPNLRIT